MPVYVKRLDGFGIDSLAGVSISSLSGGDDGKAIVYQSSSDSFVLATVTGGSLSDGDKGDITVSGSGATWTIDNDVVTYAKMQDVSATSRFIGRVSVGAGDPEELTAANAKTILGYTLASSDFANQGTTTTVLHGNAAGNPAFGAVVEADITLADNTTNDVSTSKHGFITKAPNSTSQWYRGDASWAAVPGRLIARAVYTTGTGATHNYNSAATVALIRMVGGGGGGGGVSGAASQSAAAGGGGSGGYTVKYLALGGVSSATYTVGAKGTGGSAGANNGNPGTASTWTHNGTVYSAGLGGGGTAMATGTSVASAAGGTGGSTTNGDSDSSAGAAGGLGVRISGSVGMSGYGASSFWGGGAPPVGNATGNNSAVFGTGGGGAATIGNTNRAGGDGTGGVIVVEEYA